MHDRKCLTMTSVKKCLTMSNTKTKMKMIMPTGEKAIM